MTATSKQALKADTQKLFDMVVRGLAAQNWLPSTTLDRHNKRSRSYYRHAGRKCAIGQLIKDELYDPEIETLGVCNHEVLSVVGASTGIDMSNKEIVHFLVKMQMKHDCCISEVDLANEENEETRRKICDTLRRTFRSLAKELELKWPAELVAS